MEYNFLNFLNTMLYTWKLYSIVHQVYLNRNKNFKNRQEIWIDVSKEDQQMANYMKRSSKSLIISEMQIQANWDISHLLEWHYQNLRARNAGKDIGTTVGEQVWPHLPKDLYATGNGKSLRF